MKPLDSRKIAEVVSACKKVGITPICLFRTKNLLELCFSDKTPLVVYGGKYKLLGCLCIEASNFNHLIRYIDDIQTALVYIRQSLWVRGITYIPVPLIHPEIILDETAWKELQASYVLSQL